MTVCHPSRIRGTRRLALAASLFAVAAIAMLATWPGFPSAASGCGPFGDPPQTFVANEVPNCLGGTRLGPWNDSDGTPRYACLYQPASASTSNRLPMLVWLHPS